MDSTAGARALAPAHLDYDIPESALRKWAADCLTTQDLGAGRRRFAFAFRGSCCTDGGTPFTASLELVLAPSVRGPVVETAAIRIPESERAAAGRMCECRRHGPDLLDRLQRPPDFCGCTLDEVMARRVPTNPAGCLCTTPMVAHKWRLALSTVHHVLRRLWRGSPVPGG